MSARKKPIAKRRPRVIAKSRRTSDKLIMGYWHRGVRVPGIIETQTKLLDHMKLTDERVNKQESVTASILEHNAKTLLSIQSITKEQEATRGDIGLHEKSLERLLETTAHIGDALGSIEQWKDAQQEGNERLRKSLFDAGWAVARPVLTLLTILILIAIGNVIVRLGPISWPVLLRALKVF